MSELDNAAPFVLVLVDEQVPAFVELVDVDEDGPPARDLGYLGLDDVLCSGCRTRLADGRLTPGVPLCVRCADEVVEHWLEWVADPNHDWWAADDVFGSVRSPIREWRAVE